MGCFDLSERQRLRRPPLQQIRRNNLLAGANRMVDDFDDGFLVFLSPEGNEDCAGAARDFTRFLTSRVTFACWTLESFVDTVGRCTDVSCIDAFHQRRLAFDTVDARINELPCEGISRLPVCEIG
ncbi:MAG: hypothetical protein R6X33_05045 [Candidatus Brocadiia bacterium]